MSCSRLWRPSELLSHLPKSPPAPPSTPTPGCIAQVGSYLVQPLCGRQELGVWETVNLPHSPMG